MGWEVRQGDCVELMRALEPGSVDAVVCDPPYHLTFMGRSWDHAPSPLESQAMHQAWATEALRVLKPGGHLLAFGGTRTYHRLVCAVEDAGFEIRDTICWLYGSGFPKSLDVGKAIDKADDTRRPEREAVGRWLREQREAAGLTQKDVAAHWPSVTGGLTGCVANWEGGFNCPTLDQWADLKRIIGLPDDMDGEVWRLNGRKGQPGENWEKREKVGERSQRANGAASQVPMNASVGDVEVLTAPATPEAERWDGWGTALKPAHEPICVARKPLSGTVAQTVLEHGVGGLNVDGCRVGMDEQDRAVVDKRSGAGRDLTADIYAPGLGRDEGERFTSAPAGRWPANVVLSHSEGCVRQGVRKVKGSSHDQEPTHSPNGGFGGGRNDGQGYADADGLETTEAWVCVEGCAVRALDEQSGEQKSGTAYEPDGKADGTQRLWGYAGTLGRTVGFGDTGGASRFFYTAKASRGERNAGLEGFEAKPVRPSGAKFGEQTMWNGENGDPDWRAKNPNNPAANTHPTVKPIALMRWLVRLVTPPGGLVLDPFTGSGTTGCAAVLEGMDFLGLEREAEYVDIARARVAYWADPKAHDLRVAEAERLEARAEAEAAGQPTQLDIFDVLEGAA